MYCMKCGTKLADDQVFCDSCLAEMERYPIKPGTAVHLPQRDTQETVKKPASRKKTLSAEETAAKLRKTVVWLTVLAVVLAIALGSAVTMLMRGWREADPDETIGKNYSTLAPNGPS